MAKKILWGLFFVAAAVLIIVNQLGFFIGINLWGILITIVMVSIIIESISHVFFPGIFFPLACIGIVFSEQLGISSITPWTMLIAALLLSIGFSILFQAKKWKNKWNDDWKAHKVNISENGEEYFTDSVENVNNDNINSKITFGSTTKYIRSESLRSANFSSHFGELKVFFDSCTLSPDGADVNLNCSFGEISLFIPRTWQVKKNVSASLGSVDEKNGTPSLEGPILRLKGSVSFGHIEITYI